MTDFSSGDGTSTSAKTEQGQVRKGSQTEFHEMI